MGKGIVPYHLKQIFDGNYINCTEVHETHIFQFPTSPQRVGGLGPIHKIMQCQAQKC